MKKLLPIIYAVYSILCTFAPSARAQSLSLSVSPPVVEILLAPNKKVSQTFKLQVTGENISYTPELHLVKSSDEFGHVTIDPAPLNPSSLPLIVSINPAGVAGERPDSRAVTLTFEAASSDRSRDAYLALVFTPQTDLPLSDNAASTLPGISALILITITPDGTLPINLEIKNFEPSLYHDSWNIFTLTPSLKNNADFMIRPQGKFEILAPSGKNILSQDLDPNLILGDSTRRLTPDFIWSPSWKNIGPHRLRLTIMTEGGTQLTQVEKVIWLLPIKIICVFLLFIFLVLIIFLKTRGNSHAPPLD